MFEFEVQSPMRIRLRIGRLHLRTWRSLFVRLPRGYRSSEIVYGVEQETDEGVPLIHFGAFFSEQDATTLQARLEREGRTNLRINLIPVHTSVEDWEFDR